MAGRIFVGLALFQALVMFAPPLSWPLWMLRFATIEGSLAAAVLGVLALWLGRDPWVAPLAWLAIAAGVAPGLSAVPLYIQANAPFSVSAWLTGGPVGAPPTVRDVELGPGVSADAWIAGAEPALTVVVVHGGSWRSGDKGEAPHVSAALAAAGYHVVDVRYRLSGEAPFPAAVQDVRCALVAVAAGKIPGLKADGLVILGRSAGGQIALDAAYADSSIPSSCGGALPRIAGVVSLYGVTDVAWAHDHPFSPDVVDGVAATELYLGGPPAQAPEAYKAATPQTWLRPGLPPTLLITGTADRCVRPENSTGLAEGLRTAGATVTLLTIPLADHGFDVRRGGVGEQLSRAVILDFLAGLPRAAPQ